jgi:hypothetical protein
MRKLLIVVSACFVAASCSSAQPSPATASEQETATAASPLAKLGALATDPFAQMSLTFEGNPPPAEIKPKVDRVLEMYGLELNDANRGQAGNTLVTLRKQHGHSEMAILDKMLETPASGEFEAAAASISESMNH